MRSQERPRLASALDELKSARRQTRITPSCRGELCYERGVFTWFKDHGVARQECGHDVAVGQMSRKVRRAQNGDHAMRAKAGDCGASDEFLATKRMSADRKVALACHGLHFR